MAELVGISNLNWTLSAAEIGQETDKLIEKIRKVYDQIGSLKQQDVCFENTIKVVYCILYRDDPNPHVVMGNTHFFNPIRYCFDVCLFFLRYRLLPIFLLSASFYHYAQASPSIDSGSGQLPKH